MRSGPGSTQRPIAVRVRVRGVSLVEALVSLAVMSLGMLGVVGVQATLRYNAEVSKQRSEAVRIGQEEMEAIRSFVQLEVDAGGARRAYADLQNGTTTTTFGGALTTNTSFTIERTVADSGNGFKSLRVRVLWNDRNGNPEQISLSTHIAALGPDATADLLRRETISQPDMPVRNRHPSIPQQAETLVLDNTRSVFKPPLDGTIAGTVAWVFNNVTGLIVGQCTVAAGTTTTELSYWNLAWCSSNADMHLLAGAVRFSTGAAQPSAADSETPSSPALNLDIRLDLSGGRSYRCFDDAPTTAVAAAGRLAVNYYCAITANAARTWQGTAMVVPRPFTDVVNSQWQVQDNGLPTGTVITHRLCRYTPVNPATITALTTWVPNEQHPPVYGFQLDPTPPQTPTRLIPQTAAMGNLIEQNFLVVRSAFTCPHDGPANLSGRDYVNSNTLEHLPQ